MQVPGSVDRRATLVAFGIVLRRLHVTLGVDRVVVSPVSDSTARDSHLETLAVGQRIAGHVATIAPSPDTNTRPVNVRLRLQPGDAVFEITQFQFAKVLVDGPLRFGPFAAGSAIVENPD